MSIFFQEPLYVAVVYLTAFLLINLCVPAEAIEYHRISTLLVSLVALILGLISCISFDKGVSGFQFTDILSTIWSYNLQFSVGVDGFSMIFLLLTLFIFPVLFLAAWNVVLEPKRFLNFLLAMELLLVLTFYTTDIVYFFILFESLLIPMFILIGVWGARDRKIKAAYYFFLYTLFGSLFMLFGIFYLYFLTGSTNYYVLMNSQLESAQQDIIWICFFIAFAVKMPLFPFHIWLPEAHVEAPTVGSMLLASLLLKLGGYGFLRFSLTFLSEASTRFAPLLTVSALLGVIYGALATIRQIDLKRIIAYSSVSHMNLTMLGLFSRNQQGIEGAIYLMVAHGVVSAALFFCIGVLYDRHHSRLLRYYGGLVKVMPLFSTLLLAFSLANMGFPGTANFPGELGTFQGIFNENPTVAAFSALAIVLGAVYSVWLYNRVAFGTLKVKYISEFTDLTRREFVIGLTLLLWMVALGLSAFYCLDLVHMSVKSLLAHKELLSVAGPWWEGHQFDAPTVEIVADVAEEAAPFKLAARSQLSSQLPPVNEAQNSNILLPICGLNCTDKMLSYRLPLLPTLVTYTVTLHSSAHTPHSTPHHPFFNMTTTYQPTLPSYLSLTNDLLSYTVLKNTIRQGHLYSSECAPAGVMELPSLLGTVFVIFFTGLSGIVFNYKNFLVTLMCVEAMYLGAVSSFAIYGATFRDPSAAINALLVLIFGACESAIGLGLLVAAYRFVHRIDFLRFMMIGG